MSESDREMAVFGVERVAERKRLLGLCGLAGAGKDSLAQVLVHSHGFQAVSFSGILKDVAAAVFCWDRRMLEGDTEESRAWRERVDPWWADRLSMPDLTPRMVLQRVGTDLFRAHFHDDMWVAHLERRLALMAGSNVVITDCRFENEVALVRRLGGRVVRVVRPPLPAWFAEYELGTGTVPEGVHRSEYCWVRAGFDTEVLNDGPDLASLEARAHALLSAPKL